MPERQVIFTYDAEEVQGKGAWIKVRSVTRGEAKQLAEAVKALTDDDKAATNDEFVASHVYEWNWVDEDGAPLPLPKDDRDIMDRLTVQEIQLIGNCIAGQTERKKS